jgi:hypothetical protein
MAMRILGTGILVDVGEDDRTEKPATEREGIPWVPGRTTLARFLARIRWRRVDAEGGVEARDDDIAKD